MAWLLDCKFHFMSLHTSWSWLRRLILEFSAFEIRLKFSLSISSASDIEICSKTTGCTASPCNWKHYNIDFSYHFYCLSIWIIITSQSILIWSILTCIQNLSLASFIASSDSSRLVFNSSNCFCKSPQQLLSKCKLPFLNPLEPWVAEIPITPMDATKTAPPRSKVPFKHKHVFKEN